MGGPCHGQSCESEILALQILSHRLCLVLWSLRWVSSVVCRLKGLRITKAASKFWPMVGFNILWLENVTLPFYIPINISNILKRRKSCNLKFETFICFLKAAPFSMVCLWSLVILFTRSTWLTISMHIAPIIKTPLPPWWMSYPKCNKTIS